MNGLQAHLEWVLLQQTTMLRPIPRITIPERAFAFAAGVMRLGSELAHAGPAPAHVGQQLFRAAASVGANVEEGQAASSRRDMAGKYAIALREAKEALYWLRLLLQAEILTDMTGPMAQEADTLVAILTTSVRKLRQEQAAKTEERQGK